MLIIIILHPFPQQILGSFSQSPTVTDDTLNPLNFILLVCAINLVAIFNTSLLPSILVFHNLSPITDVLVHTF